MKNTPNLPASSRMQMPSGGGSMKGLIKETAGMAGKKSGSATKKVMSAAKKGKSMVKKGY